MKKYIKKVDNADKRLEIAYSGSFRPPFRRDTGHCSGVNPASIPM